MNWSVAMVAGISSFRSSPSLKQARRTAASTASEVLGSKGGSRVPACLVIF